jgi:hypothetical protein
VSEGLGNEESAFRFFRDIEDHFVRLRRAPLVLSPGDWQVAAAWQERGIPLSVVLRALDTVFEKAAGRPRHRSVQSLAYCRHAVEEEYARHLEASVGARGVAPRTGVSGVSGAVSSRLRRIGGDLERSADAWTATARGAAGQVVAAIRLMADRAENGEAAPERLEAELLELERSLLDVLAAELPEARRVALVAACEERLAAYRHRMNPEVLERTRNRCIEAGMRREHGLTRLSLLSD